MNKDPKLESTFDEYFKGVKAPASDVTSRAKNSIKHGKGLSDPVRRALIAIASVASACASAIGLIFTPVASTVGGLISGGNGNHNIFNPPAPPSDNNDNVQPAPAYYAAETLTEYALDPYSQNLPDGLDFVKKFNLASNFSVNGITEYRDGESSAFVKTEISAIVNTVRQDSVIYTEYTADNSACEIFEAYYDGENRTYKTTEYTFSQTFENGEYVSLARFKSGGVKYYLSVKSSDSEAYYGYLNEILY